MATPTITTSPSAFPKACTFTSDNGLISAKAGAMEELCNGKNGPYAIVSYLDDNKAQQWDRVTNLSNITFTP